MRKVYVMTLKQWIIENRELIDTLMDGDAPGCRKNDSAREEYVRQIPALTAHAIHDGVEL